MPVEPVAGTGSRGEVAAVRLVGEHLVGLPVALEEATAPRAKHREDESLRVLDLEALAEQLDGGLLEEVFRVFFRNGEALARVCAELVPLVTIHQHSFSHLAARRVDRGFHQVLFLDDVRRTAIVLDLTECPPEAA